MITGGTLYIFIYTKPGKRYNMARSNKMHTSTKKLCYILPKYADDMDEHYFHVIRLLEEIGRYADISLIIEKADMLPKAMNVKEIHAQRFGKSNIIMRFAEMLYLAMRMRRKGYRKFFVRTSQTAFLPVYLVTKIFGGKVYFWRSGLNIGSNKKNKLEAVKDKLFSEIPFAIALKMTNYLVTGPESMADYFVKEWGVDRAKILILYNDIDTARFNKKADAKAALGIGISSPLILFVHRLSEANGADRIVSIAQNVLKKNDAFFLIAGEGAYRGELEKKIASAGIEKNIRLIGRIPNNEIQRYYSAADIFMMPSREAGFPRVLLEAMASGIPFVATDVGGVRDIVTKNQEMFIVAMDDLNLFSDKLLELTEDSRLRKRLGEENAAHVKKYDVCNIASMYIDKIFEGI